MFIRVKGDWGRLVNSLPGLMRVDLHFGRGEPGAYMENMGKVWCTTLDALKEAQEKGFRWVLFTHGYSTSLIPGKTTSRSQVRSVMRSKDSSPYIIKNKSYHHESVFIAAIKPRRGVKTETLGK